MIFTASQNLRFTGRALPDGNGEPHDSVGALLDRGLQQLGLQTFDDDCSYECGYSFGLLKDGVRFALCIVETSEPDEWMLQLICTSEPGWFSQLLGRRAINRSRELREIAVAIQEVLKAGGFSQFRWAIDDFPDDASSTSEPRDR